MKKLLIIALTLIGLSVNAQKKNWSAVHLNNGSVIRGIVLEENEEKITLETYDKSIWVFNKTEVKQIEQVEKFKQSDLINIKEKGYYNITDFGLLFGNRTYYYRAPVVASGQMVNGYKFNKNMAAGIGVGIEYFSQQALVPVFAELRYDIFHKAFTPFVSLQGGYSLPTKRSTDSYYQYQYFGGLMINPTVGVKKWLTDNIGLIASVGFRHQQNSYKYSYLQYYWDETSLYSNEITNIYNRLSLRLGLVFN